MKIIESILTANPCYTVGMKIKPRGLMLHSVGCPQPSASVFVKNWNRWNMDVCVHAFIDAETGAVHKTLPWDRRGWHAGGGANDTHIGVEMCEPDCIKYTSGASFTCSNPEKAKEMVKRTYESAVELFAHLCKEYSLDPLADGVIISHSEGAKRGIASGHSDPEHMWRGLGMDYTMDGFRKAVKAVISGDSAGDETTPGVLYRVQVGAFSKEENADAYEKKVKAAGFDTYMVKAGGLYKIQTGAFSQKANAEAQLAKVKKAGFGAFITTESGEAVSAAPVKEIKVGSIVRVKPLAKTYTGGSLASYVYGRDHTVSEMKGNRVVITFKGEVVAAIHKNDLMLVK